MSISVASPPRARRAGIAAPLRTLIGAALALEGRRAGEIAVLLTDDRALRDLNRRWRGIDRATDVLSFVYEVHRDGRIDGDLAVSLQRMAARAHPVAARLVIHGALHLAGLDHAGAVERRRMRRCEHQALRAGAPGIRALERSLAGG